MDLCLDPQGMGEVIATLAVSGCGLGGCLIYLPKELTQWPGAPECQDEVCIIYRHENRHILAIQSIVAAIKQIVC